MQMIRSRNVILLALSQAIGNSAPAMVVLAGGILGANLAPDPALATLPIALLTVGVALSTIPAALLMHRIGRRRGYMLGSAIGSSGALLAAYAAYQSSFGMFNIATTLIGTSMGFVQQYRFGAAESVPEGKSGQAISLVLLGGIAAGFLGPEIAKRSAALIPSGEFSASFLILAALLGISFLLLFALNEIIPQSEASTKAARPLEQVVFQPVYLSAVMFGAVAYGVMSFIMTATPLQMHNRLGFSLSTTGWVIQSHIIAMYLPSLFTGFLIARLGLQRLILIGAACLLACVGLGILSQELLAYWGSLVLLGVGWNFLFVSGTVLLTRSYQPSERFKAQAVNDFTIFGIQAFTSLSAGTVLFRANWNTFLLFTLPPLLAILLLLALSPRSLAQETGLPS